MDQELISVGIDVGTSTTQVVFSRLSMADVSGYFSVPKVDIVSKEIIYRGGIHETPLVFSGAKGDSPPGIIDAPALTEMVRAEFALAGFNRVDTGAVIITGESARKENARSVLESLSGLAGDFVVATAGPDLEAVIAGQGSGAQEWSRQNMAAVANLDIGGGTTNIAVFVNGETAASGSYDVGGRLVRVSDGKVSYLSRAARETARWKGIALETGDEADPGVLSRLCGAMAELLEMAMGIRDPEPILEALRTPGAGTFTAPALLDGVFLSGGVADAVYEPPAEIFAYGDIGVLLGRAIGQSGICTRFRLLRGDETIRATVVGAGSCTVRLSGSTIFYRGAVFPRKNLPVLRLSREEEAACYRGEDGNLAEKIRLFLSQRDAELPAIALTGMVNPGYGELNAAAGVFARAAASALSGGTPLIILTERDMAKALGQLLSARIGQDRPAAVLDSIQVGENTYIDIGSPVMEGIVVPVVIKTLIFG